MGSPPEGRAGRRLCEEPRQRRALLLGLRGAAHAMMKAYQQAMKDFSKAVPIIIEKNRGHFGKQLKTIIQAYIDLLNNIRGSDLEDEFQIDPSSESFHLVNAIFNSYVQEAIWAMGIRASAAEPDLSDLIRKEQDLSSQINALKTTLSNILAIPVDQQNHLMKVC